MAAIDINAGGLTQGINPPAKVAKVKKAAPNVMPQMAQEHGQGGRKKASQIIADYVMQQTGNQQDVQKVMGILNGLIERKISRLIQFGNTVFWATQAGRGTIDVHIASLESPKAVVKHIREFYQWCKNHGFTKITSTFTDHQQLGVVKLSGLPFTLKPTQVNTGKQMVPGVIMTMQVR